MTAHGSVTEWLEQLKQGDSLAAHNLWVRYVEQLVRLDEVVMFHALLREHLLRVVDLQLAELERLLGVQGIGLAVTDEARRQLVDEGYDPNYGARPLKRVIQRQIQNPLAMAVLQGEFKEGDTVQVGRQDERFSFHPV